MNEQLSKQASEILTQILSSVKDVSDFSMKQLPDIAQQYIFYGLISNSLAVILLTTVLIINSWWIKKRIPVTVWDSEFIPLIVVPIMLNILIGPLWWLRLQSLILNISAPKVWLILEIKNLLS